MPTRTKKKTIPKEHDYLPVFEYHGTSLESSGTDLAGLCPFCEHDDEKFFLNQSTGQWQCKNCGEAGNVYTFLHKHYLSLSDKTDSKKIRSLAKFRNLHPDAIKNAGFAHDQDNNRYILPIFNRRGSLVNLKTYSPSVNGRFYNTPNPITAHIWNSQKLSGADDTIYICEGEWDGIALEYVFDTIPKSRRPEGTVIAVPGADSVTPKLFTNHIISLLQGKRVILVFDHDDAGTRGMNKLAKLLVTNGIPDVHVINWPDSYPTGYDISDHITKTKLPPEKAWAQLEEWIEPISSDVSNINNSSVNLIRELPDLPPRTKFSQVLADYRKYGVSINRDMEGGLALSSAVAISNELPGDPLWLFLVGPSGCISGDAHLKYVVRKNGKRINCKGGRFKTLYERFHGLTSQGPRPPRAIGAEYYIQSVRDDGTVFLNKIEDVIDSGVKTVYRVTTDSGKTVKATSNHPFLTPEGYVPLAKLGVGDIIIAYDGKRTKREKKKRPNRKEIYVKNHKKRIKKVVNGCTYYRVMEHQAVIEADRNGMTLEEYIHYLNTCTKKEADSLWTIPEGVNVHHIDEDPHNNSLSNLALLSHLDHVKGHWEPIYPNTVEDRIVSIEEVGEEQVYDLKVADPYKNFVVEGLAVHNSGKSLLLESTLASPNYIYRTTTNYTDLLSGYKGEGSEEATLIRQLIGKTFVIKDYTTILTLPFIDIQKMNGLLRDAYDGSVVRSWGNGLKIEIEGFFSIVAGVTNKIHSHQNSNLGERFLKYEIAPPQGLGNRRAIVQALSGGLNAAGDIQNRKYRQASFCSFTDQLRTRVAEITKKHTFNDTTLSSIISMSQFVSLCRSVVERDRQGALLYEASPEAGTRLAKQLSKLPQALCHVYGLRRPDDHILRIVRKTAWDSAYSRIRSVFSLLYHEPDGLTTNEISEGLALPKSTAQRTLADMHELKIVRRRKNRSKDTSKGRPEFIYKLVREATEIYSDCGFPE